MRCALGFLQLYLRGKKSSGGFNEDERKDLRKQADKRTDFSEALREKKRWQMDARCLAWLL